VSDGESKQTIRLGLLADPDVPADIARELAEELPEAFARHVSDEVD